MINLHPFGGNVQICVLYTVNTCQYSLEKDELAVMSWRCGRVKNKTKKKKLTAFFCDKNLNIIRCITAKKESSENFNYKIVI